MIRVLLGCTGLVAAYFAFPLDTSREFGVRLALTLAALALTTWLIWREMRRELALKGLLLAMVGGVLVFALTDYMVATTAPGQFTNLNTRIDALYFALSTGATIGFGDVHAQGQLARAVLCLQMVFNVAVLASAGSILVRRIEHRALRPGDRHTSFLD